MGKNGQTVSVQGRTLKVSSLDKVMYPSTGTTKSEVLDYYARVATTLIPHAMWRPATRKRWVDGVGTETSPGAVFFRKFGRFRPKLDPHGQHHPQERCECLPAGQRAGRAGVVGASRGLGSACSAVEI